MVSAIWRQNWDIFNAAHLTSDGGYICAGGTTSFGNGLKDDHSDGYLVKTDGSGKVIWQKTFGGSYGDRFFDVAETPDNGFVAVGVAYSAINGGITETYVVKVDKDGKLLWSHALFPNDYFSFGASVCVAPNGNIGIAAYHVKSLLSADQGTNYQAFILLKPNGINLNYPFQMYGDWGSLPFIRGNIIKYEVSSNTEKIIAAADGFVFAANLGSAMVLFKVNSAGGVLWNHTFTGLSSAYMNDITTNATGGFLIAGGTIDSAALNYTWLLNTDVNGNKINESYTPLGGYSGWASGVVRVGNTYAMGLNLNPSTTSQSDIFGLLFTDQNGKIIESEK